jgi:hypothetical protein
MRRRGVYAQQSAITLVSHSNGGGVMALRNGHGVGTAVPPRVEVLPADVAQRQVPTWPVVLLVGAAILWAMRLAMTVSIDASRRIPRPAIADAGGGPG